MIYSIFSATILYKLVLPYILNENYIYKKKFTNFIQEQVKT